MFCELCLCVWWSQYARGARNKLPQFYKNLNVCCSFMLIVNTSRLVVNVNVCFPVCDLQTFIFNMHHFVSCRKTRLIFRSNTVYYMPPPHCARGSCVLNRNMTPTLRRVSKVSRTRETHTHDRRPSHSGAAFTVIIIIQFYWHWPGRVYNICWPSCGDKNCLTVCWRWCTKKKLSCLFYSSPLRPRSARNARSKRRTHGHRLRCF